ncbi:ParA family protein [Mesorhizobium sp. M0955]|uniref:ParA family protein n=1 Tax=Mesorhizobium sp. M0955 TaxID=2957033 RepID=UPI0033367E0E
MSIIIACLSQKGGVGKSTLARLLAWTYASAEWQVKICDFNTKQLTSVDWVAQRMAAGHKPDIAAEPYSSVKGFRKEPFDLLVVDGRPDSDNSSLDIARVADLCVLPTGLAIDDLKPQVMFANELRSKGIPRERILLVLNKITESEIAVVEARAYLRSAGYAVAETDLAAKTGYQMAQNAGKSIAETNFTTLNDRADELAAEIVARVNELPRIAA